MPEMIKLKLSRTSPRHYNCQSTDICGDEWDYYVNHYEEQARQKKDRNDLEETIGRSLRWNICTAGSTLLAFSTLELERLEDASAHNALITIYFHEAIGGHFRPLRGLYLGTSKPCESTWEIGANGYLPSSIIGHGYNGWLGTSLTSLSLVVEDQKLLSLIVFGGLGLGKGLLGVLVAQCWN